MWEVISTAIQRKLAGEMPETDEEMAERGAGGSRRLRMMKMQKPKRTVG